MGIDTGIFHSRSDSPDISTSKTGISRDRAWVVVAGEELPSKHFECAVLPDGPGARWEGGEYRRIETKNAVALSGDYFSEPDWQEVVSPDGVIVQVTRFRRATR
jgi:hypothetical protein